MRKNRARRFLLALLAMSLISLPDGYAAHPRTRSNPFESFVLNGDYLSSGQTYFNEEKVAFALLYESVDKEPMLLISNGADDKESTGYYIFSTDADGKISCACSFTGPIHSLYYYPDQSVYSGFFCSKVVSDHYDTVYFTFDGGSVITATVSSLMLDGSNTQKDRVTDDMQLYDLSISSNGRKEIQTYTKNELLGGRLNGWNDFQSHSPGYTEEINASYFAANTSGPQATDIPEPETTMSPTAEPTPTTTPTPVITPTPTQAPTDTPTPVPTEAATIVPEITPEPESDPGLETDSETMQDSSPTEREYPSTGVTTIKKVNVRTKPQKNGRRIAYLVDPGTIVTVIGEETNADGELWYKVRLDDKREGFVSSNVIRFEGDPVEPSDVPVYPFLAKTNVEKVIMRTKADSGSRRVSFIEDAGTIVTVLDETTDKDGNIWYKVKLNKNTQGYVKSSLLIFYSSNVEARPSLTEDPIDDFSTITAYIKLGRNEAAFSGPGKNYTRGANGKAYTDTTNDDIYVYGRDGDWVLIRYYVEAKTTQWRFAYIPAEAFTDDSIIPELNFARSIGTIKKNCSVSDDPLSSKNSILKAKKGESVTYLAQMGDWAYIEVRNTRGFIRMDYLKLDQ